jgi:hypothetical protein
MIDDAEKKVAGSSRIWAITSYFNPLGYRRRRANYRTFRQRLRVPLVTVELAEDRGFDLGDNDAEILLRVRNGDLLFQKERLLNVALRALPAECDVVAWIDCDVVLGDDGWPERALRLLDDVPLVHLFSQAHYLPPDLPAEKVGVEAGEIRRTSIAFAVRGGADPAASLEEANRHAYGKYSPGFAWAARRAFVEGHGFYDSCILGGGDRAMVCAQYGCFEHVIGRHRMNEEERAHYLAWAQPFHDAVRGAVGCLEGDLFHLWHGSMENRRLRERYQGLAAFDFDPQVDLRLSADGAWLWNSGKPAMHAYVRSHFVRRLEDG